MNVSSRRYEAERSLLTQILTFPEVLAEIELQPEHFHDRVFKNIFITLNRMHEEKLSFDGESIAENLLKLPDYENIMDSIGGFGTILNLFEYKKVDGRIDFRDLQQVIFEEVEKEKTFKLAQTVLEEQLSAEEAIERFKEISTTKTRKKDTHISAILRRNYEALTTFSDGVSTGFADLDKMTQGFRPGEFIVLGARPAMGKTAFALNLACNMVKSDLNPDGCVVALFSMEMSEVDLSRRIICMTTGVHAEKAKNPPKYFTEDDWKRFNHGLALLSSMDLEIADTSGASPKTIKAEMARIRAKYGEDRKIVVIIDYLQLMQGKGRQRTEDVSEISRSLKLLAKDDNFIVIALSQLSRGVEARQDKRPMLSDLRESGSIEQDADIVSFLYCDYYYNPQTENKNITELIIAKQRAGSVGKIDVFFDRQILKFKNMAQRKE